MTQEYKPLANGVSANVVSQAVYEALLGPAGALEDGYESGVAPSSQVNKTLRQSSVMTSAMGDFIVNVLGGDLLDDGNVAALATKIFNAINQIAWTTGDVKLTMKTAADTGWIMCSDGTIGSATSGATYANANAQALFLLLWTNIIDAWAPVVGGRGGSAAADWAANKRITLTKMLGRALAISGAGVGLTARVLGQNLGEEGVVLSEANLAAHVHSGPVHTHSTPNHVHSVTDPGHGHGVTDPGHEHGTGMGSVFISYVGVGPHNNSEYGIGNIPTNSATTGISVDGAVTGISISSSGGGTTGAASVANTGSAGGATAHNNMQPTSFLNAMIKL